MPTTLIPINPVGTLRMHSKCAHHFDLVLIGGHIENIFKKKPWGFFHKFTQNASKLYLSHSLRVLSENAPKYVLNMLNHISNEFTKSFC